MESVVLASIGYDNKLIVGGTFYAAGNKSSPYVATWNKPPVGVEESNDAGHPHSFDLRQNFPNPFNPETKIRFSVPRGSRVKIEIFNLLGQTVRLLVDQYLPAGDHVRTWNGTDNGGGSVGSGVYFYRLTINDMVETRKMILLK